MRKGETHTEPSPYDPVFANNTWGDIIEACQTNRIPRTWVVGDSKPMTIDGTSYQIDIIGKNHDTYTAGGVAPLTFQMHDCYTDPKPMSIYESNSEGWTNCQMRTTTLPAILATMPSEVQSGIKEVKKLTSAGNQSATIKTTSDKLFLLSEIEVIGTTKYSASGEGSQYEYYAAGNSKRKGLGSSQRYVWWERSPFINGKYHFCGIDDDNNYLYYGANVSYGVAFAFCF